MDGEKIVLGGREYPIAPLPLGKVKRASKALQSLETDSTIIVDVQMTLILMAVSEVDASFTMETLEGIKGVTLPELNVAAAKIMVGLTGPKPGE